MNKRLNEIIEKHKKWLAREDDGKRADLSGANLRGANLREADLREADLREADLSGANLSGANLREADLSGANLREADLSGANLDFSCLPLWCGSLSAHFDDRQLVQIAYHLCKAGLQSKNASAETKQELRKIVGLVNQFHRVEECGYLTANKESEG